MRRIAITTTFAAALLAHVATAAAEVPDHTGKADELNHWHVRAGNATRFLTSQSAANFIDAALIGGDVAVEYHLLTVPIPGPFDRVHISAEADFEGSGNTGQMFDSLATTISNVQLTVGGRARLPLWRGLSATGSAALGGARTNASIDPPLMSGAGVSDDGTSLVSGVDGGFEWVGKVGPSTGWTFGLALSLGYTTQTAVALRANPTDRDPDALTIDGSAASLGDLDLDGWTMHIGAVLGF